MFERPTGDPQIYTYSSDPRSDAWQTFEEGYQVIGKAYFYGPPATMTRPQLVDEAKKVGASLVLVHPQYKDLTSGVIPWSIQSPTQLPTVDNTDSSVATFWVRADTSKVPFGAVSATLPDSLRAKLHLNTGIIVGAVVRGTPASDANILRNDIILKIGGEDVIDKPGFREQTHRFAGQTVELDLLRNGTPRTVWVTLRRPAK